MTPLVSIIIPCYNQAAFLPDTIRSLQAQTLANWECIVVDDGSTDESAAIVRQFANQDIRIRLLSKSNGGSASARNAGLQQAQGEYIQFLDADDIIQPDKLLEQTEQMKTHHWLVSYTGFCWFTEDEQHQRHVQPTLSYKHHILFSLRFSLLTRWGIDFSIPQHALLYQRAFLERHQLSFNEQIRQREDWCYLLQVSRHVQRNEVGFIPSTHAWYRSNPTGKTGTYLKISDGNFRFIQAYKPFLTWREYPLWAYRLSAELWMMAGRVAKYRELEGLNLIGRFMHSLSDILLLIIAILLLPLSFLFIAIRSIFVYL